jgi:hypothetical protein
VARVLTTSSGSKLANFIGENWLIVTSFPNCRINLVRKNTRMKSAAFIKRPSKSSLNSESLDISRQVAAYCLDCGKNRKILSVQQYPHRRPHRGPFTYCVFPIAPAPFGPHLVIGLCIWGRFWLLSFSLLSSSCSAIFLRYTMKLGSSRLRKGERIKANGLHRT